MQHHKLSYPLPLLVEVTVVTAGVGEQPMDVTAGPCDVRHSARAVLVNTDGLIAVQYLARDSFYKLPGGGVEAGEGVIEALHREVREEVGADCEVLSTLGMIIEYRDKYRLCQISYAFRANVVGEVGEAMYEPGEIASGQETMWLSPEEALHRIVAATPTSYEGHFIKLREAAFLGAYLATKSPTK